MKAIKHLERAKRIANILDTKYSIGGVRFGADAIISVIPGIGSIIGAATSCYVFWIADQLNVPNRIYYRMALNIAADLLLGGIPVIGVLFDIFYKANVKNIRLLENFVNPEEKVSEEAIEAEIVD
jgi:hypothetical protein